MNLASLWNRYVGPYLKAHVAGLGAGITLALGDAHGNLANLGNLTQTQWGGVVAATGLLGGAVGYVTNKPFVKAATGLTVAAPAPAAVSQDSGDAAPAASA